MTLHNVIIYIKSVLNEDKKQYYYKIFLGKCSYHLAKKESQNFVHSKIIVRFGERKISKEKFYAAKRPI